MLWPLLAFPCGTAYFQHHLGYYRYPEMRCITVFEQSRDTDKEEALEMVDRI